jgi:choice-of-anchor B domain-containing protein
MKKTLFTLGISLISFLSFAQVPSTAGNINLTNVGELSYSDIPFTSKLNDIWGYVSEEGKEYALVGLTTGFSIVDIDNPAGPTEIIRIPGPKSVWRDIKTYNNFAYITHDSYTSGTSQGLLIVDLNNIDNGQAPYQIFDYNGNLDRAHNIYIDENGIAYLTGANVGVGGALMVDVTGGFSVNVVGNYNNRYLHDCVTRNDTMWGGAIYDGVLVGVDVTDKSNPTEIGDITTPSSFTHNCWFSDDGRYVFTTDEVSDAYIAAYDVSDPSNIQFLDQIQSYFSELTIPHNAHYLNGYLINSYYRDGLQILDVQYPDNMIDVGRYDTSPLSGDGFNGAWGAYPYLPSGKILVSDIEGGLFVFQPEYKRGGYLHISVVDSMTDLPLSSVNIEFDNTVEQTNIDGLLKTGSINVGNQTVKAFVNGYQDKLVNITLTNGVINNQTIKMLPYGVGETEIITKEVSIQHSNEEIIVNGLDKNEAYEVSIYNYLGKQISTESILNTENYSFSTNNLSRFAIVVVENKNGQTIISDKIVLN